MADLYLDHNVPRAIGEGLATRGHTCRTVRQLGLEAATDDLHLLRSAREGWTILTHDAEDYELLHRAWIRWGPDWNVSPPPTHAGILVLPQLGASVLVDPVAAFLAEPPPLANRLYRWRQAEGWLTLDVASGDWAVLPAFVALLSVS